MVLISSCSGDAHSVALQADMNDLLRAVRLGDTESASKITPDYPVLFQLDRNGLLEISSGDSPPAFTIVAGEDEGVYEVVFGGIVLIAEPGQNSRWRFRPEIVQRSIEIIPAQNSD